MRLQTQVHCMTHEERQVRNLAAAIVGVAIIAAVYFLGNAQYKAQQQVEAAEAARAEAEVRRDEALKTTTLALRKAALIIESSPWALVVCDEHGVIKQTNAAAEKILGWSHDEMVGKPADTLMVPPAYREIHDKMLAESAAKLKTLPEDYIQTSNRRAVKSLTKSGEEIDAIVSIRAIKSWDGIEFILSLASAAPPASGPLKLQAPEKISDVEQNIAKKSEIFSTVIQQNAKAGSE